MDQQLTLRTTIMRIAFGLTAALAGLDKFFNVLADWGAYVSPAAAQLLPISVDAFMYLVGIIELAVGIAVLGAAPVIGLYVASAWLLLVGVNLLLGGYLDIAVRDVVMSVSALTLARFVELTEGAPARATAVASAR